MIWDFLTWLEDTEFSLWVREGDFIGPPFAAFYLLLGIHSIGMAIVVGICMMLTSRLFGFQLQMSAQKAAQLMSFAWWGFYINFVSGMILYIGQPRRELLTVAFWIKMLVIVLAVITMRVIQKALENVDFTPGRGGAAAIEAVPMHLRIAAFLLNVFWLAAIVAGRLIGYTQPPPGGMGL